MNFFDFSLVNLWDKHQIDFALLSDELVDYMKIVSVFWISIFIFTNGMLGTISSSELVGIYLLANI